MGRYCGEDYGEARRTDPLDFLSHRDAIAKREQLGAGWVIIRASIFYRVTYGAPPAWIVPDPPQKAVGERG